jgi:hypothetical protein
MQADAETAGVALRERPGRLDGIIQLADAGGDLFDEPASGVGQTHAARTALEQQGFRVRLRAPEPAC